MTNPDKLKILAIIPSGFCFGLQHITVDFFSKFPGSFETHFLLTRWGNGELAALLEKENIPYSYSWLGMFSRKMDMLNLKMSFHALIRLPKLYVDFFKLQKKFRPDIIYFANHHELILLYPVLVLNRRKVVCHMHDPGPSIRFQKITFKWYGRTVDHFIAISENVRQRTIELGCNPGKITTIHNGINIPVLKHHERLNDFVKEAGWSPDVFIIGITGQMTATKGHLDLLEAFRIVFSRNPLTRLVIGGKPQEPMYSELKKKIVEWNMENFVFFPGWLPDVSLFFQNIDVFVLASTHDEGYGLVVAEAMAHELPVVITESGGAVEIVAEGESGYVVPKKDSGAMAVRLYELSLDSQKCIRMGENAKKRVTEKFNLQKQAAELAAFLFNLKRS